MACRLMRFGGGVLRLVLAGVLLLPTTSRRCGSAAVKFLKLHKVGSSVMSSAIERYGERHNISLCPYERRPGLDWKTTVATTGCGLITGHPNSESVITDYGFGFWMYDLLPDAVSVIVLREPRERLLSRFFFDNLEWSGGWQDFEQWLMTNPREHEHYLSRLLGRDYGRWEAKTQMREAVSRLRAFSVVAVSEALVEGVASVALAAGCGNHADRWSYSSEKVVVGRPGLEDAPKVIRHRLRNVTESDRVLHAEAKRIAAVRGRELGEPFRDAVALLRSALADGGEFSRDSALCEFRKTHSAQLEGNDCYRLRAGQGT